MLGRDLAEWYGVEDLYLGYVDGSYRWIVARTGEHLYGPFLGDVFADAVYAAYDAIAWRPYVPIA